MTEENEQWRRRLQEAVQRTESPPELRARIRIAIDEAPARKRFRWNGMPVAASALGLCVALAAVYQAGELRFTAEQQESYIASILPRVAPVFGVGLGDHVHCTVYRKFPKLRKPLGELVQNLEPRFHGLAQLVSNKMPDPYQVVLAHQCKYKGRKFVHVAMTDEEKIVSLIVAKKDGGEGFSASMLKPALEREGIPVYQAGVQRFQVAGFENREYLVYVVSDLDETRNREVLARLAPGVRDFINNLS